MTVFVDTCFFIATLNENDQWHQLARNAISPRFSYLTSSMVLSETLTLLQTRRQLSLALDFLARMRDESIASVVFPDKSLQLDGWDLFHRWGGCGASPVDCVSFAIMRRLRIRRAFTFDQHFRTAGFETLG
jgi:predicted nucleic acid-binding protein